MNQATRETCAIVLIAAMVGLMAGLAIGLSADPHPRKVGLFFREIGPDNASRYVKFSLQTSFSIDTYKVYLHDKGGSTFAGGGWSSGRYQNIAPGTNIRFVLYITVGFNETYYYELYEQNQTAAGKYYWDRVIGIQQSYAVHANQNHTLAGDCGFGRYGYEVQVRYMGTEWWNNWK